MMGKTSPYSSPDSELEIKIQARQTDPHQVGGPHHRRPRPPPPPPYQSFKKWFPWMVPIIVVVNVALFVIAMYLNNCPLHSSNCIGTSNLGRFAFQSMKENPLLGPSSTTLEKMGALEVNDVVQRHEAWRLASCMWLHAGVFHVVANMVSLLFVGIRLEQEFGFVRIILLYTIAGIGGSLLSSLFVRTAISVGASGALFGLLGAMLSELLVNWTIYENKFQAILVLMMIILINLSVGILPHVDNFAHVGGFVTGFLLGFVLLIRPQYGWVSKRNVPTGYMPPSSKSKYKAYQYILLFLALILLISGFAFGFGLLLSGVNGNEHCSWCRYLSCVPTPFWNCQPMCSTRQLGNQVNMTCLESHKSKIYMLSNGIQNTTTQFQMLCTDLCS